MGSTTQWSSPVTQLPTLTQFSFVPQLPLPQASNTSAPQQPPMASTSCTSVKPRLSQRLPTTTATTTVATPATVMEATAMDTPATAMVDTDLTMADTTTKLCSVLEHVL